MGLRVQMGETMTKEVGIKKRLFLQQFMIITLTVAMLEGVFFVSIYQYYYKNTEEIITSYAKNAANFATRFMDLSPFNLQYSMPKMIQEFKMSQAEMQIVSPSGEVLMSSSGFSPHGTIDQLELVKATLETPSTWVGENPDTGERILAAAVPLEFEDEPTIYFRFVISLEKIDEFVKRLIIIALCIGVGIVTIVLILSYAIAKRITTPLTHITNAAKQFSNGNFDMNIEENYIGELGTLAKSFNEMSHSLQQHETMKNRFISSVSHELRTPLTSIKGWSETLLSGNLQDKQETETGLRIITNETDRLIKMVEELLDFSRLNNETMKIEKMDFKFHELVDEVVKQFDKQLKKKQVHIRVDVSDEVSLHADRNRIKQLLINLIDNALNYSGEDSVIEIKGYIQNQSFIGEINDNGCGIKEEDLKNIHKPFYKANENTTGTGLGLAICQQIINLHNGQLIIKSEVGVGTKAAFMLPV